MPKCVVCMDMYHPDFMMEKELRGDQVTVCVFCGTHKKELTIEDEDGKVTEIVKKKEASIRYKKYLDELTTKPEIAKVLQENTNRKG